MFWEPNEIFETILFTEYIFFCERILEVGIKIMLSFSIMLKAQTWLPKVHSIQNAGMLKFILKIQTTAIVLRTFLNPPGLMHDLYMVPNKTPGDNW